MNMDLGTEPTTTEKAKLVDAIEDALSFAMGMDPNHDAKASLSHTFEDRIFETNTIEGLDAIADEIMTAGLHSKLTMADVVRLNTTITQKLGHLHRMLELKSAVQCPKCGSRIGWNYQSGQYTCAECSFACIY